MHDASLRGEARKGDAGCRRGEINHPFRMQEGLQRIAGDLDADRAKTGDLTGVAADKSGAFACDGGMQLNARGLVNEADERLSHAARRADHHKFHAAAAHAVTHFSCRADRNPPVSDVGCLRSDVKDRPPASQASHKNSPSDQALQRRPSSDRPKSDGVLE
ncbi:hypothetical protein D3C78_1016620 [compost metagenome]